MQSILKTVSVTSIVTLAAVTCAHADLRVQFKEGAPKDRFVFTNIGECPIETASVLLNMAPSDAGLIFDVTSSGAGVEVYQPLEFVAGSSSLSEIPSIKDGDNQLQLDIVRLNPDASIAFTIDVDDTRGKQATMVSDSELSGVMISVEKQGDTNTGTFRVGSELIVKQNACGNV